MVEKVSVSSYRVESGILHFRFLKDFPPYLIDDVAKVVPIELRYIFEGT